MELDCLHCQVYSCQRDSIAQMNKASILLWCCQQVWGLLHLKTIGFGIYSLLSNSHELQQLFLLCKGSLALDLLICSRVWYPVSDHSQPD